MRIFFLISGFSTTQSPWLLCAPEGAVDAVLLGFQLLWELVYLKTLLSNVYCPCFKKEIERASISLSERMGLLYGYTDGLQLFFYRT
jgi:hypothetical protein